MTRRLLNLRKREHVREALSSVFCSPVRYITRGELSIFVVEFRGRLVAYTLGGEFLGCGPRRDGKHETVNQMQRTRAAVDLLVARVQTILTPPTTKRIKRLRKPVKE